MQATVTDPDCLVRETLWNAGDRGDTCRMAHNPEVAGSNPAPATSFRRSGPFPSRERAFCVPSAVARRVAGAGLRAAWQRDGGDGVTRDEVAWTWWTLPPAIAGRVAQRYPKCRPIFIAFVLTEPKWVAATRVRPGLSPTICGVRQPEAQGAALARGRRRHLGHGADAGALVSRHRAM